MKRLSIIVLLAVLYGCGNKPEEAKTESTPPIEVIPNPEVTEMETDGNTSATARPNEVSFNGTIVIPPQYMATVTLTLGGVIKNTSLIPGQYVQRGTVLATLENPEFIELQQTWLESKAQLEYLETEYKRQETLSAEQAASQKKFQQSKAEYLSMKSRLEASAAQLSLLGISTNDIEKNGIQPLLRVKAPIGGYISSLDINTGKYLNAGEPLCEIIDKGQTMLKLTTYEKDLTDMHTNMPVEFRVNGMGDKTFKATILSIGQRVNEVSRSLDVYAKIEDKNTEFRPGMYVTAKIKK